MDPVEAAKRRARGGSAPFAPLTSSSGSVGVGGGGAALLEVFKRRSGKLPVVLEEESRDATARKENVAANAAAVPQKSFFFQQRHGRVDIRAISRIDLDRLVSEVDVEKLQAFLENITFAELDPRELAMLSDENFLKLFRLTQLTLEYLLNVQQTLYAYTSSLEGQLAKASREQELASSKLAEQNDELRSLKRDIAQRKRTLKTYEFLLTQHRQPWTSPPVNNESAAPENKLVQSSDMAQRERRLVEEKKLLVEQTEQLRKSLYSEVESIKQELERNNSKLRREAEEREANLREKQDELYAKLDKAKAEESQRSSSPQRKPAKLSLAGADVEEDDEGDDEAVASEVFSILRKTNAVEELKRELSRTAEENRRLRDELAIMGQGLLAKRQTEFNAQSERQRTVLEEAERARRQQLQEIAQLEHKQSQAKEKEQESESSVAEEPPPATSAKGKSPKDGSLMLSLAASKVSRQMTDLRSMQLRRVLRITRRRIQFTSFRRLRDHALARRAAVREHMLRKELEALKLRSAGSDEESGSEGSEAVPFAPTYRWQQVPPKVRLLPDGLEIEQGPPRRARIPSVWTLSMQSSLGSTISVAVSRTMTVEEVRSAVSKQLGGKTLSKIALKSRKGGSNINDGETVESADLFTKRPFVDLASEVLNRHAVDDIVDRFATSSDIAQAARRADPPTFSPIPGKSELKALWSYSHEELDQERQAIDKELGEYMKTSSRPAAAKADQAPRPVASSRPAAAKADQAPRPFAAPSSQPASDALNASKRKVEEPVNEEKTQSRAVSSKVYESVPVNFGDYDSDATGRSAKSPNETSSNLGKSSVGTDETSDTNVSDGYASDTIRPLDIEAANSTSLSKKALIKRHQKSMSRFAKVGLIRRAQVDTLNLSDDSGSSGTNTSVSSSGASRSTAGSTAGFLSYTARSQFSVGKQADRYAVGSSDEFEPSVKTKQQSEPTLSTKEQASTKQLSSQNLGVLEDDDSDDSDVLQVGAPSVQQSRQSSLTTNLLDELEDDESD